MKRCYLDANFLVYYKNRKSLQHKLVLAKLDKLIRNKVNVFISTLVIDEFIFTLISNIKRKGVIGKNLNDIKKNLIEVLNLNFLNIAPTPIDKDSQLKVIDLMSEYNLKPRDAYHLLTIISNSIDTFATFDNDFKKVFSSKLLTKI
ncbi:hypothetical protein A2774_00275 [Candidatus Roizmanbacteria bacterium RIFCSPHIGHO2_01_FULL_39_12c]|uniref:PIN domain-containing protein n=1 Tax=Candidatus Roizmanbacteria bacterium RIFCSPHIGHO2_01_FULL_39_12c TaxID=1802031 RepID=A0A1F7GEY6_9BACT|nr:MAG: hypothetical protein A2774_00275 [Candidatus Roizmanbacteria bacterium RIFCSPHIGHO2_01_FULL_39_12c]